MIIKQFKTLQKINIISPSIFKDHRGEFIETYSKELYKFKDENGEILEFVEDDISVSHHNVLRGLHGDKKTWKLIQCLYGEIYFTVVDFNPMSETYLKSETIILDDKQRIQVLVPPFYVNGYYCISEECIFSYKQSCRYSGAENQVAARWNDPILGLKWPSNNPILSQRDGSIPSI